MAFSRPVIAFALLSQCSEVLKTDLIGGIAVLLRPLMSGMAGQRFSTETLCKRIADSYGIAISAHAIEDLMPRLEQAGLIELKKVSENANEAVIRDFANEGEVPYEAEFEEFLSKFLEFATKRLQLLGIQMRDEDLISGLLSRLATFDFQAIVIKPDRSQRDKASAQTILGPSAKDQIQVEAQVTPDARLDVLVAGFISHVVDQDPGALDLAKKVAEGALGAELVFDLRAPKIRKDLSQITVVLDTPLVLSLLDLSDRQNHKLATELVRQIRHSKASLAVFHHSILEAEGVLKAVQTGMLYGDAYGPTAERMRDSAYVAFFQTMLGAVERRLVEAGFRIIPPTRDLAFQYFTKDTEDSLTNRLRFGALDNRLARERDSLSVAETIRLRAGVHVPPEQIEACRYVFVTSNPVLQKLARGFLVSQLGYDRAEFPPIITDRTYCGLAWLMFGGASEQGLPVAKLLANCAHALRSRPDVVARTHSFLKKVDSTKAMHFEALMTSERAARYLTEISLGDSLLITEENAVQIYSQLEAVVGEKIAKEKDEFYGQKIADVEARIANLNSQLEQKTVDSQKLIDELEAAQQEGRLRQAEGDSIREQLTRQAQLAQAQGETVKALDEDVRRLGTAVSSGSEALHRLKKAAVEVALTEARARQRLLQYSVLLGFVALSWVIGYADKFVVSKMTINVDLAQHGLIAVQVLVAAAGFWVFTDHLFGRRIHQAAQRHFVAKLNQLGYDQAGPEFRVDHKSLTLSGPNDTQIAPPANSA